MKKKILIVHTRNGAKYAKEIAQKITTLGTNCFYACWNTIDNALEKHNCTPENTLIHYRCTGSSNITPKAFKLEQKGFSIINCPDVLRRTGDKFHSYEWASSHGVNLPITKKGSPEKIRKIIQDASLQHFVLKPVNSVGMGKHIDQSFPDDPELEKKINKVPGKEIVIQEFIDYKEIYRVIVIGGTALVEAVFSDKPTKKHWKVSVCLNPQMKHVNNPDPKLIEYAKWIAQVFKSEIAFIDIYRTNQDYVLSEINTACNLRLHERLSGTNISQKIAEYLVAKT
jgi:glutathione synthase/RimK-type ligase-like ATP-grasp enzyme